MRHPCENLHRAGLTDTRLGIAASTEHKLPASPSAHGTPSRADDSELAGRREAVCPWHNRDKEASFRPEGRSGAPQTRAAFPVTTCEVDNLSRAGDGAIRR